MIGTLWAACVGAAIGLTLGAWAVLRFDIQFILETTSKRLRDAIQVMRRDFGPLYYRRRTVRYYVQGDCIRSGKTKTLSRRCAGFTTDDILVHHLGSWEDLDKLDYSQVVGLRSRIRFVECM